MASRTWESLICNACKNNLTNSDHCKAFNTGIGIPKHVKIRDINGHSDLLPIQENDYLLEPALAYKWNPFYEKYSIMQKLRKPLIPRRLNAYQYFDLELHTGVSDYFLFHLLPNTWLQDIPYYTPQMKTLLQGYNQGTEIQALKKSLESNEAEQVQQAFQVIRQKPNLAHYTIPHPKKFKALEFATVKEYYQMNFLQALLSFEELDLDQMEIQQLPPQIAWLKDLQYLNLSHNQLQTLPPEIGELNHLIRLDLFNNHLLNLPESLQQLQHLQKLDLYHNQLSILPFSVCQLPNLQSLGLNHNQLQQLPQVFRQLQSLQRLYITHNHFTQLPEPILELQNLKHLYLSGNQIEHIPENISKLQNLNWLGLARNQIKQLPENLSKLPKLEWLDISANPLPSEEVEKLRSLLPGVEIVF